MKIRKALALVQIVCIIFLNVSHVRMARADDSDIFGSNIAPNVLILFDDSGSMDDKVPASGYNSSTTYTTPNTYTTAKVYRKYTKKKSCKPSSTPCYKEYASTVSAVSSSSAQTALNSAGYWSGKISGSSVDLFVGNYLNYSKCTPCQADEKRSW